MGRLRVQPPAIHAPFSDGAMGPRPGLLGSSPLGPSGPTYPQALLSAINVWLYWQLNDPGLGAIGGVAADYGVFGGIRPPPNPGTVDTGSGIVSTDPLLSDRRTAPIANAGYDITSTIGTDGPFFILTGTPTTSCWWSIAVRIPANPTQDNRICTSYNDHGTHIAMKARYTDPTGQPLGSLEVEQTAFFGGTTYLGWPVQICDDRPHHIIVQFYGDGSAGFSAQAWVDGVDYGQVSVTGTGDAGSYFNTQGVTVGAGGTPGLPAGTTYQDFVCSGTNGSWGGVVMTDLLAAQLYNNWSKWVHA